MIRNKIEEWLSKKYYCSIDELNGKETVYSIHTNINQPYIKIMAYRNCIVVCTSEDLHEKAQELLRNKNRDEIFEFPFVYGQTIHYVPSSEYTNHIRSVALSVGAASNNESLLSDYGYHFLFDQEILSLNGLTGFENSLALDEKGNTPTKAIYVARDHEEMIGIAGASLTSVDGVYEVGVDVVEKYRHAGLATCLVSELTRELLARNIVPFYSASVTNIASQMVANRCRYLPMWVDTFGTTLDGSSVYNEIVSKWLL